MKIDAHKKRLKSIKSRYVFFPEKCGICKEEFVREKMWQFYRRGINNRIVECYYCQHCMHSAEEVLDHIESEHNAYPLVEKTIFF